jgi:hypothetical protein
VRPEGASTNSSGWRLIKSESSGGVKTFALASWSSFFDFLEVEVFHAAIATEHSYVWRGQPRSDWSISSSLDRLFQRLNRVGSDPDELEKYSQEHLESFKYATRGRRGANPASLLENEWWALGQHFGLATPLLDWTRSPFAAAYFAFDEIGSEPTKHRVVCGLDQRAVKLRSDQLLDEQSFEKGRPPVIEFVDPMSDENQRLVSQSGLFTRAPIGIPVEQWVKREFRGSPYPVLLRIKIPDSDRLGCLRTLNRMNINHVSLFQDLAGASRSTNLKLELDLQD